MTFKDFKNSLLDLIQKNKLEQTIRELNNLSFTDEEDSSTSLSSRIKEYKKLKHSGTISVQELSILHAQITTDLIFFVKNLEEEHILSFFNHKKSENMQSSENHLFKKIEKAQLLLDEKVKKENHQEGHPHYKLISFLKKNRINILESISNKIFKNDENKALLIDAQIVEFLRLLEVSLLLQNDEKLEEFFKVDKDFELTEYEKGLNHLLNIIPPSFPQESINLFQKYITTLKNTLSRIL